VAQGLDFYPRTPSFFLPCMIRHSSELLLGPHTTYFFFQRHHVADPCSHGHHGRGHIGVPPKIPHTSGCVGSPVSILQQSAMSKGTVRDQRLGCMGLNLILNHSHSEPQSLDGGSPSQLYMHVSDKSWCLPKLHPAANVDLRLCPFCYKQLGGHSSEIWSCSSHK
jgi:hypothetical protein